MALSRQCPRVVQRSLTMSHLRLSFKSNDVFLAIHRASVDYSGSCSVIGGTGQISPVQLRTFAGKSPDRDLRRHQRL